MIPQHLQRHFILSGVFSVISDRAAEHLLEKFDEVLRTAVADGTITDHRAYVEMMRYFAPVFRAFTNSGLDDPYALPDEDDWEFDDE